MWKTLVAVVVLVAAVGAGVVASRGADSLDQADLAEALASVPGLTLTANFTDWAAVRSAVDAETLTSGDEAVAQQEFLDAARDDDLSVASVLVGSASQMAPAYGFNVLDLRWELLAQAREGAAVVVRLDEGVDVEALVERLDGLGYARPEADALTGGVWVGGGDLVAGIEPTLTPLLAHVAVVADRRLLVLSAAEEYAEQVSAVVTSGQGSLLDADEVADVATPLAGDLAAVVHRGEAACTVTSFAHAAPIDRRDARLVAARAGRLEPFTALGFGVGSDDGSLRLDVSMRFADGGVAAEQRAVRTTLAKGAAIGQGGSYEERFRIVSSTVRADVVTLGLAPVEERMNLVSDLAPGPLMFAWCAG